MTNSCFAYKIDGSNWALCPQGESHASHKPSQKRSNPVSIHYVVDNSASMGRMTHLVRDIFSEMVDSVATAPCSLTVFDGNATILSSNIETSQQMRDLCLPSQGSTNIPAGISKALRIIHGQEIKARAKNQSVRNHHILVLLSDGQHNHGPSPDEVFPTLRDIIPAETMLSVVVVGYSRSSNTSMGMALKESIETVGFQAEVVQTIYFATTGTALRQALARLQTGLNMALKGSFHEVEVDGASLIENFGSEAKSRVRVHQVEETAPIVLLHTGESPPERVLLDGEPQTVSVTDTLPLERLTQLIQGLIDRTKIQVVASKSSGALVKQSVCRLTVLVNELEARIVSKKELRLQSASSKERISQFRVIKGICSGARALRNQVLDIANFENQGSEDQATFLNGRTMKYANKALRRAAKNDVGVVDPKAERNTIQKYLTSEAFVDSLRQNMVHDSLSNLARLSNGQVKRLLIPLIRSCNVHHANMVSTIWKSVINSDVDQDWEIEHFKLSDKAKEFVMSGTLAEYINDALHGKRHSYLSLSTPRQHVEEWLDFADQSFESTWEMLMYAGFVGYPLVLEHTAAAQMNPFLLQVKGIRPSLVDTASICCANQAEVPVYGPEGGEPIQDVLVLVDPSMPRSSKMICSAALLGEKFTSATVARDLHMYTGINMRVALHANSLFYLTSETEQVQREDVVANLRRSFMGRAFMCSACGFGPVDHYACADLMAHHEEAGNGGTVNNACPKCGWFSPDLSDWERWDGTVCEEFIQSSVGLDTKKDEFPTMSEAKIDLILRTLYSFRKTCSPAMLQEYASLAESMATNVHLDFSAKAGVDGLSQLLVAVLAGVNDDAASEALGSQTCLVSVLEEACSREARNRFRKQSGGDKVQARENAVAYLTDLLGIQESTAPHTLSAMEAEPPMENIRLDCDDSFDMDHMKAEREVGWVRAIAKKWCRAWSFARGLHQVLSSRTGGWPQLEKDMETACSNYKDVIDRLKTVELQTPKQVLGLDDVSEVKLLFLNLAVGGIMVGAAEKPCQSDVFEFDQEVVHEVAREMRMIIYHKRVAEKMASWKEEGEREMYFLSLSSDLTQFSDLVEVQRHVHGFDKQTFWGLWKAAKESKSEDKMGIFLKTANEAFQSKHHACLSQG